MKITDELCLEILKNYKNYTELEVKLAASYVLAYGAFKLSDAMCDFLYQAFKIKSYVVMLLNHSSDYSYYDQIYIVQAKNKKEAKKKVLDKANLEYGNNKIKVLNCNTKEAKQIYIAAR